jgi:asparagine synthase (glutamine-hydrolysing)
MCGIAGEIALTGGAGADWNRAVPMLRAILHRGPDGVGAWGDPERRFAALHARLSLIDLAGGAQPMLSAEGDIAIVYNGEIYGHHDHRRALEARGAVFRNRTDTEVLIQLYRAFGPDFVTRLEGEFAFALFDLRSGETFLVRDRYGVKPLFVSERDGLLLFASEIKGILAHPLARRELDHATLDRRLHGVFLPGETVFAGVGAVEPGEMWTVSRAGISRRRWFDLDPLAAGSARLSAEAARDALDDAFGAAISGRLKADVPVGLFLSGGIDSSAVAAYAAAESAVPPKAFIIDFAGSPDSEAPDALATAQLLGLPSDVATIAASDMEDAFHETVWRSEIPLPNPHGAAKLLLARRARQSVKAVLTGEGADELHGGYAWFRHSMLLAGNGSGDDLAAFLASHGLHDAVAPKATAELRQSLAWTTHGGAPYTALRAALIAPGMRLATTRAHRGAADGPAPRALLDWLSARAPFARRLAEPTLSQFAALLTDLPGYNLVTLGDRVEMASGLEGRLPFLDRRVAELLWSLPPDLHVGPASAKTVLRAALATRLPEAAARRKKMFVAPQPLTLAVTAGAAADDWLSREATRAAGVFRPRLVSLFRRLGPRFRPGSRRATLISGFLTSAASVNLLHRMFCEALPATLDRYAPMSEAALRAALAEPLAAATE